MITSIHRTFVPNKKFGQLLNISPHVFTMMISPLIPQALNDLDISHEELKNIYMRG